MNLTTRKSANIDKVKPFATAIVKALYDLVEFSENNDTNITWTFQMDSLMITFDSMSFFLYSL